MPNVRHTPKRRRADCPKCGRNISYTHPWIAAYDDGVLGDSLKRDTSTLLFKEHRTPEGQPCTVNGSFGMGYRMEVE